MELLNLVPYHDHVTRAELLCIFWARTVRRCVVEGGSQLQGVQGHASPPPCVLRAMWAPQVDRAAHWTDVLRKLSDAGQVMASQRLGYCNVFNPKRPSLHYRLRMFRPDEHEIAWQLFNMAVDSPLECFTNVTIDGEPKKINEVSVQPLWPSSRQHPPHAAETTKRTPPCPTRARVSAGVEHLAGAARQRQGRHRAHLHD